MQDDNLFTLQVGNVYVVGNVTVPTRILLYFPWVPRDKNNSTKTIRIKKKHPGAGNFFLGLVDPSRNRLAATAYFAKPCFSALVELF